jgi:hydrogenase-4 component B
MTGPDALFAAGFAAFAAAAALELAARTGARSNAGRRRTVIRSLPYLAGAVGSACLAAVGALAVAGRPARLAPAGWLGAGTSGLVADRLSGLFLLITFGAATLVSLAFADWASRPGAVGRRGLGIAYALTLAAVAVFMTATDAFTALLGWELVTVGFYLLAGFQRGRPGRPGGALVTLVFGKVSGIALLTGLLLLAGRSGSLALAAFAHIPAGAARATGEVLLIAGFAVKAGLVPFQVWLPRGYAAAPGPARAIMAGVAVNIGFYGLWRTLALLGAPPSWLVGLLLVLAGLTALLGIAHAAVQPGLQRVIAYSSVENSGLIITGYAVALTGAAVHDTRLLAAGLLAATLQIIAHTAAKSLLFTASAVVAPGTGVPADGGLWPGARPGPGQTAPAGPGDEDEDEFAELRGDDDLDGLRGVVRRLPWSGTGLAVGSLTLAGLPLTAGFASEWFLLEALMQQFRVAGLGYRLALALAGAAVALTVGFAGVTFVRLTGMVVLGAGPRRAGGRPDPAQEYGWAGRTGLVALAVTCLLPAALLPLVIRAVAAGLSPVVADATTSGALKSPWVVQPVFSGFSILSPSWLWVVMPLLGLAVLAFGLIVSGGQMIRVRRVPAWRSATAGVEGADRYTASGFAGPARRVLASVLHTRAEVAPLAPAPARGPEPSGAGPQPAPQGPPASRPEPSFPQETRARSRPGPRLGYSVDVVEVVETYLYRPVLRPVLAVVRAAKRLQSGRLDAYLAYMLIALVALIAVVTAMA